MTGVVLLLLQVYLLVLVGRAILSWFPIHSDGPVAAVNGVLFALTEPVLRPVRRIVPRTGMIDLSFIIVFLGVIVLQQLVASA
jgi:YggT family protein